MSPTKNIQINKKDQYLIIFEDTGEIYQEFRSSSAAEIFLERDMLKPYVKIIPNPKYIVTTK